MSEETVVVEEKVKERKNIYINKSSSTKKNIYLKLNESDLWEVVDKEDKEDKDGEGIKTEELEFTKVWWKLSVRVDSFSTKLNELGLRVQDPTLMVEMTIRYYLKKCSFYDLEFEKDEEGFERISESCWEEMVGKDGLSPEIILGIFKTYREISEL